MPAGAWHTVEVLEPSVIFEAKDGAYGKDGSEVLITDCWLLIIDYWLLIIDYWLLNPEN